MDWLRRLHGRIRIPQALYFQSTDLSAYFGDNESKKNLSQQALHSGIVSVFARGLNGVAQVGSTIVLARLLEPEDFGLVAMVAAIAGLAPALIDLGMRDAVVQKSRISHDEISALFWLSVVIGGGLAAVTVLCGPLIAYFYHESQLEKIAQVWALLFILAALTNQHNALLRRALKFQTIATIDVAANVLGAVGAIMMALAGGGYWALVAKPLLTAFINLLGVLFCCRWVPGIPKLSDGVREMLRFGSYLTAFTIADYVGRAGDRVALGYTGGAKELGYYQNANVVYDNLLTMFVNPLHTVAVSSLSKLRDNVEKLRQSWFTALSSVTFFTMPAFIVLAVIAQDLVVLLLGEKWEYAGAILSVLSLRGPAHVVDRTQGWLHVAAGRADRWMRWGVLSSIVQLIALFCGLPFGTMGVAIAYTVATYVLCVPAVVYSGRTYEIATSNVLRAIGPQFLGSLCAAGSGFLLRYTWLTEVTPASRIAILACTCTLIYVLVTVGVLGVVKPLHVLTSLLLDFMPARISRLVHGKLRR